MTTCPRCMGDRFVDVDVPCELCDHGGGPDGEAWHYRCPSKAVPRVVHELAREWRLAVESAILPGPGGLRDQDPAWLEGFQAFEFERGRILAEKRRRAE